MEKNWIVFSLDSTKSLVEKIHFDKLSLVEACRIAGENTGFYYTKRDLLKSETELKYNCHVY